MKTANYPIIYGDRIFARVINPHGKSICELTLEQVSDLTEVFGEVRQALRSFRGLVRLIVRNYTRGWSKDQPMMFYGDFPRPRLTTEPRESYGDSANSSSRMLKPWETH